MQNFQIQSFSPITQPILWVGICLDLLCCCCVSWRSRGSDICMLRLMLLAVQWIIKFLVSLTQDPNLLPTFMKQDQVKNISLKERKTKFHHHSSYIFLYTQLIYIFNFFHNSTLFSPLYFSWSFSFCFLPLLWTQAVPCIPHGKWFPFSVPVPSSSTSRDLGQKQMKYFLKCC